MDIADAAKELAKILVPVALDLAHDIASAKTDDEMAEARRRAEDATSDRIKLWQMSTGASEPALPSALTLSAPPDEVP